MKNHLKAGNRVDYLEEKISTGHTERHYVISIQPIIEKNSQDINAAVLRLNPAEKVNALTNTRIGARAT
ncbi:MAG: hypothetical protein ACOX7U_07720 [Desulfitobacteriia bacterium]